MVTFPNITNTRQFSGFSVASRNDRLVAFGLAVALLLGVIAFARMADADVEATDLIPVVPARLVDTRTDSPDATVDGDGAGAGAQPAGATLTVPVAGRGGVPADAVVALLSVKAVDPEDAGHFTVFPCGGLPPLAASVNFESGQTTDNTVLSGIGAGGAVCIYTSAGAHVVADVTAYGPSGGALTSLVPTRVLDTRVESALAAGDRILDGGDAPSPDATIKLKVTGRDGIPEGVGMVVLNVAAVSPSAPGFLTVYSCDAVRTEASNLNYQESSISSSAVFTGVAADGTVCIYSSAATDVVVDVSGFIEADRALGAVTPARLLDTRAGFVEAALPDQEQWTGLQPAGSTLALRVAGRFGVRDDATAAMLNFAAVGSGERGYLTVYPCGTDLPLASSLNFRADHYVSGSVLAKIGEEGTVCVYTSNKVDVVVDVNGFAAPTEAGRRRKYPAPTTTVAPTIGPAAPLPAPTEAPSTTTTLPATTVTTQPAPTTTLAPTTTRPATTTVAPTITTTTRAPVSTTTAAPTTTISRATPPAAGSFVHPGVFLDRQQLDEIRADVAAGRQPATDAFNKVLNSGSTTTTARRASQRFSSLSYTPMPVPVLMDASSGNVSYAQSHGLPEAGEVEHSDDARAAYTHALLWYVTGNQAYANKAIEIMNAWSSTLTEIKFASPVRDDNGQPVYNNGKLQAGWGGSLFARAAEIVRHTGAGWASADVARFETMLHELYLPLVIDGWSNGANWMMTFSEATIAIGVFTDDRAAFDAGVAMWRQKMPTTIYLPADGAYPIPPASSFDRADRMKALWYNPTQYISGLETETLRDLAHMTMGLGAMANAAATAYIQGIDLYAEQEMRMIAGFETNARFVNAYLDEVARLGGATPSSSWVPAGWPGAAGTFRLGSAYYKSGWLVAWHHYTEVVGRAMPETTRLVNRLGTAATQPAIHNSWETLTHFP